MTIELHHFFVLVAPGAPEAELLKDIGMVEGTPGDHPGQGTSNRRFFFANAYLELIYLRDADEASDGPARGLRIAERARDADASPFGLIVERTDGAITDPFSGWRYFPDYFDGDQYFLVGDNSNELGEPLCICIPISLPAQPDQVKSPEPFTTVTELRVSVRLEQPSPTLERFGKCERVTLQTGAPHLLEIIFNGSALRQSKDLRPDLPLVIRW